MGKSSASAGPVMGDNKGTLTGTVSDMPVEDPMKKKQQNALAGAGAGIAAGLSSLDQQAPQVQAGPQLGSAVNQPQQVGDSYSPYIQQLGQKKPQVDFFGNPIGSGY